MNDVSDGNFGLVIAYVVPGFAGLWAVSPYVPTVQNWLAGNPSGGPTVGSFLYVTLVAIAMGLIVSAVRWMTIDWLHHKTGVVEPTWDFSALQMNLSAFEGAVQNHYRYHQFYGNTLTAFLLAVVLYRPFPPWMVERPCTAIGGVTAVAFILFVASRDALSKYYRRSAAILHSLPSRKEPDHDQRLASPQEKSKAEPTVYEAAHFGSGPGPDGSDD